jgi:hypothetical protein
MKAKGRSGMADRGPNQDFMHLQSSSELEEDEATFRDDGYLGTGEGDEEDVKDLGFIVDDHDDRRIQMTGRWQRLDDLDTDEPLETNRHGNIPHETALREKGVPREYFFTQHQVKNAQAEAQEEDFVQTSMLDVDPDMNAGAEDFTDETIANIHGGPSTTDIAGHVTGVAAGLGTSLAQDLGRGGFQIRDNPLMQPEGQPISGELLSDEALGLRDVDEMGSDADLERLADQASRDASGRGSG